MDSVGRRYATRGAGVAVPLTDGSASSLCRRAARPTSQPDDHGGTGRIRPPPLVGVAPAWSVSSAPQGCLVLPPERRGRGCGVPSDQVGPAPTFAAWYPV